MRLERAERRFSGRCIVAAPGPSLTPEVAELCRGECVVAVNDAYRMLPWAEVTYACDAAWWEIHSWNVLSGEKWTSHSLTPKNDKTMVADRLGLRVIAGADKIGFSRDPALIHYGNNSGFQATNLVYLWGADPIILVAFDMQPVGGKTHFFGEHKAPLRATALWHKWIGNFAKASEMLGHPRPTIINATPGSAMKCFPIMPLAEALAMRVAA